MYHYITLLWCEHDSVATAEAERLRGAIERKHMSWSLDVSTDGVVIYSAKPTQPGMRAYVLPGNLGMVFGRMFSLDHSDTFAPFSVNEALRIADSAGEHLLQRYWGNYVAILGGPSSRTHHVVRDCSGRIPCYFTNHRNVNVFFSDLRDVSSLQLPFSINEIYLARLIDHYPLYTRETGFNEIEEVLPGGRVEISAGRTEQHLAWNPMDLSMSGMIHDYSAALSTLRQVTERAIGAWASVYKSILLNLSGGLDSAIVLACLAQLGFAERVICVNNFTPGTTDDERLYARAAADMVGVQLIEFPRVSDGNKFISQIQKLPLQPKPDVSHLAKILMIDDVNCLAGDFGCDSVWSGQGGDHIFLQGPSRYGAADYLIDHRFPWRLAEKVHESSILSRESIWSIAATAAKCRIAKRYTPGEASPANGHDFLPPSVVQSLGVLHGELWNDRSPHLPPGKQNQIEYLMRLLNRHKPIMDVEVPYEQHPLISQPLIELSLRVPIYHLQRGGRQRAMARHAFADVLPQCIKDREDKGSTDSQVRALLRGSERSLCEMLLDGSLVSLGIIARQPIERILRHHDTYRVHEIFPLLCCIAAEMWIQKGTSCLQ